MMPCASRPGRPCPQHQCRVSCSRFPPRGLPLHDRTQQPSQFSRQCGDASADEITHAVMAMMTDEEFYHEWCVDGSWHT
eukprot:6128928-Prymnesium_polylepis.2